MDGQYQGLMAAANTQPTNNARREILGKMADADGKYYENVFRPLAHKARESFANGDMATFGNIVGELSSSLPMPYRYKMGQDGSFGEMFRSTQHGGYVDTGRKMSPLEVMEGINEILKGEHKVLAGADMQIHMANPGFLQRAAQYRLSTAASNAEAMADESQWIKLRGKDGRALYAIPQNRHDDYSTNTSYMILDEKAGKTFYVNSKDELGQIGKQED